MLQERMKENERQRQRTSADIDPEMARYLEDERLALALQNSEFLQELRSNDDFMKTLEKGNISFHLLTLVLLEPKGIRLCHQYRARPACTSVQSDQALYCWLTNFKF